MARHKKDIGSKEIYEHYKKNLDTIEKGSGYDIPRYVINSAIHEVNKRIMNEMLMSNTFIKLPYGLGTLSIFKNKPELKFNENGTLNLPRDMKSTYELWESDPEAKEKGKYIYFRNKHTGGYIMYTYWTKNGVKTPNISGYAFRPVKDFKRKMGRMMNDPLSKIDFYERKRGYTKKN